MSAAIVHVHEPDHSKAREVYVALDLLLEQIYPIAKETPRLDFTDFGVSLKDATERVGAVWISANFSLPLTCTFETNQARYRLVRTRKDYRCEIVGPAHKAPEQRD